MTKNRYIPYGYRIRNGKLSVHSAEAETVKAVFRLYRDGQSYKAIAEIMNDSDYPPHGENGWNKHHIKRMLENGKYIGESDYPAILTKAEFHTARDVYAAKGIQNAPTGKPADVLWERLACGGCGSRLLRNGSPASAKGLIQLRCENSGCGHAMDIPQATLHSAVLDLMNRLIADVREHPCGRYEKTLEALRMANEISRGIARPDEPGETAKMILQGITERYGGIKEPPRLPPEIQYGNESRLFELDWELFKGAVSHISLAREGMGLTTIIGYEIFMEREGKTECKTP